MLSDGKKLLRKAYDSGYAVGAFNINNLEALNAVVSAAEEMNSPVFVAVTAGAIKYAGIHEIVALVKAAAKDAKVPIALHLDHGPDIKHVRLCLKEGFTSVMIDGSALPFEKNVAITRQAVKLAHAKKVGVEAELGRLKGSEDWVQARKSAFTAPDEAKNFIRLTNADYLAVAIGTSHGAYKFKGNPKLDIQRLREINSLLGIPLVLHGASAVSQGIVKEAGKYGAKIEGANGVPDSQIKAAVRNGVAKVNADTDLRIAFMEAVRKFLSKNPSEYDPRKILSPAVDLMKEVVKKRIKLLGSEARA
ncbi:MAG: class II fructose-1,6-bisphosphate aldolase [Candidatus Woesearchaeota archaeon]